MKRLLSIFLAVLLCAGLVGTQAFADNREITWEFDKSTATLTIKGSGPMEDFRDHQDAPWAKLKFDCEKIIVENGVESIGQEAFTGFVFLKSVVLADSVKTLGPRCFSTCMVLESVSFPSSLVEIKDSAFSGCGKLKLLDLPGSLREIGPFAFMLCSGLEYVILPDGLEELSSYAFSECDNLRSIYLPESVKKLDSAELFNSDALEYLYYSGSREDFDKLLKPLKEGFYGSFSLAYPTEYTDAVELLASHTTAMLDDIEVNVYTSGDSPMRILQPAGNDYFAISFNPELSSLKCLAYCPIFDNIVGDSGEYGCWMLRATLEDCIAFSMTSTITLENSADENRVWRVMAANLDKNGNYGWRPGDSYSFKSGDTVECFWRGEELDLAGVALAPMNDSSTDFYCESGYMESFEPKGFVLFTSRLEAARNYLRALGLEEYLVI